MIYCLLNNISRFEVIQLRSHKHEGSNIKQFLTSNYVILDNRHSITRIAWMNRDYNLKPKVIGSKVNQFLIKDLNNQIQ